MKRTFRELPTGLYIGDFRYDEGIRIREDGICPCLTASMRGPRERGHHSLSAQPFIIEKDEHGGIRIRTLTPRECFRLQGFDDHLYERAEKVQPEEIALYKQAGNSVTVSVIYEIAKELKKKEESWAI